MILNLTKPFTRRPLLHVADPFNDPEFLSSLRSMDFARWRTSKHPIESPCRRALVLA